MGLLDRFRRAPRLRSGPLLLLPPGVDPSEVDALVAAWSPTRRRRDDRWVLDDGLQWFGPLPLSAEDAVADDLPPGYPVAYVAAAARDRGDGPLDRLMVRAFARADARGDAVIRRAALAAGATEEELDRAERRAAEEDRRYYPAGRPRGLEADAWALVCGLARRLGGTCRLADGRPQVPPLPEPDLTYLEVRSRLALPVDDAAALVRPHLGALEPGGDSGDSGGSVQWSLRGTGILEVICEVEELDLELRAAGYGDLDPLALYDDAGGRPVTYSLAAERNDRAGLLGLAAELIAATDGIVLDAEGFPVALPRH